MNAELRSQVAIRLTRMLLIRVGLREDEADEFLDKLCKEFLAGTIKDEESRRRFVENWSG